MRKKRGGGGGEVWNGMGWTKMGGQREASGGTQVGKATQALNIKEECCKSMRWGTNEEEKTGKEGEA